MTLEAWYRDLVVRRSSTLPHSVQVEGLRRKHLGPRSEYARVVFEAVPADEFAVSGPAVPLSDECLDLLRSAIFGFLDVVLTAGRGPLRNVALRVVEVDCHPIDSSSMAFREAGRDAGRKLLQEIGLEGTS